MGKKKFLAFLMILIALFAFMPAVEISGTAEMRARLAEAQRRHNQARYQVRETENLLRGIRSDIDDLMETMQVYDQRLIDAQADLDEIELVLLETEINMIDAYEELIQARTDRDGQDVLFRERLRAMHEQGPAGYLSVLFQATSFSDFLVQLEHVRSISQFDQEVLTNMQEAEERVSNTLDVLSRLNIMFEDMYEKQQAAIVALNDAQEAHWAFLASLEESEEGHMLLLAVMEATERALQEELGAVQREIRQFEDAERARRAAEEQARRQAEAAERERQAREQPQANIDPNFRGAFHWPLPARSHISSYFGSRTHPIRRTREHHTGIDIPAPAGSRINAAADGVVRLSGWHGGFGITVIIDHGNGYSTLYAHNSRNRVQVGDQVRRGDHIADVGTTGVSTGNHLHFEIRRNGVAVDPLPYLGRTRSG